MSTTPGPDDAPERRFGAAAVAATVNGVPLADARRVADAAGRTIVGRAPAGQLRGQTGRQAAVMVSLRDGTRLPCTATIVRLDPDPEWDLVTIELAAGATEQLGPVVPTREA
jgi:hypothetical protein